MQREEELLNDLLDNLLKIEEQLISVYIFDRDGLIIASSSKVPEEDEQEMILGAITGRLEIILSRVRSEFKLGNWSTGTLETEDHRLIFLEAGKDCILLLVTDFEMSINKVLPYAFLVAEKISRITSEDFYPGFTTSVPGLNMEDLINSNSIENLMKKEVSIINSDSNTAENVDLSDKMNKMQFYTADTYSMRYKTIILGNATVGKTTLVQKFTTGEFRNDYMPTLGISITEQKYPFIGDQKTEINFMIWDLAGQKFFKRARTVYIHGAQAAFLVYDCTNRESFVDMREWHSEVCNDTENIPIVLIANKIDKVDEREVSTEEGKQMAKELKCSFIETSALTGENVKEAFQLLGVGLFFKKDQEISDVLK